MSEAEKSTEPETKEIELITATTGTAGNSEVPVILSTTEDQRVKIITPEMLHQRMLAAHNFMELIGAMKKISDAALSVIGPDSPCGGLDLTRVKWNEVSEMYYLAEELEFNAAMIMAVMITIRKYMSTGTVDADVVKSDESGLILDLRKIKQLVSAEFEDLDLDESSKNKKETD